MSKNEKSIKIDMKTLGVFILIALCGAALLQYSGIYNFTALIPNTNTGGGTDTGGGGTTGGTVGVIHTANAKWAIREGLAKVATANSDTGYVCVVRADTQGYFNLLNPVEETEFDAAPDTSASVYATGDKLLIAVSSDDDGSSNDESYPRWFYIDSVDQGAPIKALPTANPSSALQEYSSGGAYKYKVNTNALVSTGMSVTWMEGATPYWIFGDYFDVWDRLDNADIVESITNKGTTLTLVNDGSTWDDTSTEVNANATLTADTEDFYFELTGEVTDATWGLPVLAVSSQGQVKEYSAVLVFCTSGTTMNTADLLNDGWVPFSLTGNTNNATWYYPIDVIADGCIPDTGDYMNIRVPISISDNGLTASTEYNYGAWMIDFQNVDNVKMGSFTTSLPTVYGFLTEYGADTVNQACVPTLASGRISTPQLYGYFTTNA